MEEEKGWLAFVGHSEPGQVGTALKLYCSPDCVTADGHKRYQPIRQSRAAESPLVGYRNTCARCGKEFAPPAV